MILLVYLEVDLVRFTPGRRIGLQGKTADAAVVGMAYGLSDIIGHGKIFNGIWCGSFPDMALSGRALGGDFTAWQAWRQDCFNGHCLTSASEEFGR